MTIHHHNPQTSQNQNSQHESSDPDPKRATPRQSEPHEISVRSDQAERLYHRRGGMRKNMQITEVRRRGGGGSEALLLRIHLEPNQQLRSLSASGGGWPSDLGGEEPDATRRWWEMQTCQVFEGRNDKYSRESRVPRVCRGGRAPNYGTDLAGRGNVFG
jgi:hypothetical protein